MMLTLGALVLLSLVILRITNSFLLTDNIMLESKIKLQAISVATSIIEEGIGLAFDDSSVDIDSTKVFTTSLSDLTNANSLGPEAGESYGSFDDIDDFNGLGFFTDDTTLAKNPFLNMYGDVYRIDCTVNYVVATTPNVSSNVRTWHKKFTVRVTSNVMNNTTFKSNSDTLKMSVIQSNFSF